MNTPATPRREPDPLGQWKQLAAVAVAAVIVSLVGMSVSSRFEAVPMPPLPPVAGGDAETGVTTTTAGSKTTSTSVTITTVAGAPASLSMSTNQIDFGEEEETVRFEIANQGGQQAQWSIELTTPGLSVEPSSGQLGPGVTVQVAVTLDRATVEEGELVSSLRLIWNGGEATAQVTAVHRANPVIASPRATPDTLVVASGGSCSPTRTVVSARVTDQSELETVFVRWSPDGAATVETTMDPIGEDRFEATIGPFSVAGSTSARVLAFDEFGNAGGAAVTLNINPCP